MRVPKTPHSLIAATVLTMQDYRNLLQVQNAQLNQVCNQLKRALLTVHADLDAVYEDLLETFSNDGAAAGEIPIAADTARYDRIKTAAEVAEFHPGEYGDIITGASLAQADMEKSDEEVRSLLLVGDDIAAENNTWAQTATTLAEFGSSEGDQSLNLRVFEPGKGTNPKRALQSCIDGAGGDLPLSDPDKVPEPAVQSPSRFSSSSS